MLVRRGEDVFRIAQVLDFESLIGVDVLTGRSISLRLGDLRPLAREGKVSQLVNVDMAQIADEDWRIAQERFAAIKPLLNRMHIGRIAVEQRGKETGVDPATLYRWLQRYRAYGVVSALIPQKRGWKAGNSRIGADADALIEQVIRNFYLTPQRPTAQKTVLEVLRACQEKGIQAPGSSAIRARISRIAEREKLRGRGYKEQAKNKFLPAPGSFPNADYPLAVMQIDHTPADIILVDDVFRKPIGRPWITLAIDVHSRMVTGYYLSFDPPSETSVAMCVAHSILPKEDWMLLHKVDAEWPVWGIPKTIHVDNGADFRSNNFQQSCLMYGISLEFRPVKQPRYGGHIERMLGTLLREIHSLPGTTFSSVKARDGYDSEKHATMTKSEFEEWLVTLICKVYHRRLHSAIGLSPTRKWEIGIFGNAEIQGVGVPSRPTNSLAILLDFLPFFRRTVQTFGVTIDGLTYYAEALRPWINAQDPETKKKKDLIFRRDPRDISSIWFFDPTLKHYYKIPLADLALPSMSIWEYQQAREKLRREGIASVDEHQILRAITELRNRVDESMEKTKTARRQAQRRKEHAKNISPAQTVNVSLIPKKSAPILETDGLLEGDIQDFGDIA
ncbi:DDE-type integrase/transposase/recombinase [Undibacterium sp. LFS511W]|uniref:DDE-type integrase/transposase/recombinase n=2 Tax=Undibacterium luofuense TaxID=2828733 RepID=A0A941DH32_9BURK|nr:DDE-type integrase/transposase/recombinase [Undibacterium luofuense]